MSGVAHGKQYLEPLREKRNEEELYQEINDGKMVGTSVLQQDDTVDSGGIDTEQTSVLDRLDDAHNPYDADDVHLGDAVTGHDGRALLDAGRTDDIYTAVQETKTLETEEELKDIEPLHQIETSRFGDVSPSLREREDERAQEYRQTYADRVRQAVTEERFWDAAAALVDEDVRTVQEQLRPRMEQYDQDLVELLREAAVDAGEDQFTSMPDTYQQNIDQLVTDAVTEAADTVIPTFPFRDGVTKRYDGRDIDPRAIQRHLVKRVGMAVAHQLTDVTGEAADIIYDDPVPADYAPEMVDDGPETVQAMESPVGQSYLSVQWNSDHPTIQETAAQAFLDDIGGAIQRARQQRETETAERLEALQEEYQTTINRFRVTETLNALDRYWGTGDMPYEVYELDNPDEMQRAAADIGNCRTSDMYQGYYQAVAEDPHTTMLGVRRREEHEWIGVARLFHMTADDGRNVLAIDNLGMQYKDGQEAGNPKSSCNFTEYGDAVPVMGLASIAYGLEEGFDTVIAGGNDGRVGGGPGDHIGVAQLYSTKNTDLTLDDLEKQGDRDIRKPWGLRDLRYKDDRSHALLMETPPTDWAA